MDMPSRLHALRGVDPKENEAVPRQEVTEPQITDAPFRGRVTLGLWRGASSSLSLFFALCRLFPDSPLCVVLKEKMYDTSCEDFNWLHLQF